MKIVPNPHITERGISSRLNHKSFIEHARKTQRFKSAKITRAVDKANHQVLATLGLEDQPLQSMISIYPEFIAYTYNLYGFSRKLLMYIIFYELDKDTCRFLAGAQMMKRFHNFCFLFAEETEAEKNVLQAI